MELDILNHHDFLMYHKCFLFNSNTQIIQKHFIDSIFEDPKECIEETTHLTYNMMLYISYSLLEDNFTFNENSLIKRKVNFSHALASTNPQFP